MEHFPCLAVRHKHVKKKKKRKGQNEGARELVVKTKKKTICTKFLKTGFHLTSIEDVRVSSKSEGSTGKVTKGI